MCMSIASTTAVWVAPERLRPCRNVTLLSSCYRFPTLLQQGMGLHGALSPSLLGLLLPWSCASLIQNVTPTVGLCIQICYHVQQILFFCRQLLTTFCTYFIMLPEPCGEEWWHVSYSEQSCTVFVLSTFSSSVFPVLITT